ncbi:hypothetical protein NMY22_g1226 [Coprinellus aureogranulatus]|nr:hypothetical protein NMY22_g1226 [Coprinellus aureogranulatus]
MSASSSRDATFRLSDLPRRGDREAPRWDGSPFALQDFLDDFEDMCRQYRVPQERMVDALLRIAPNYDTRAFWNQTPGADEERRYTRADLSDLVVRYQSMSNMSMDDFSGLWTRFYAISQFLQLHGRLSEAERSNKLLGCLPIPLRTRVKAQLRLQYLRHHAEDPLPLKEVYDVIVFVLSIAQERFEGELVPRTQKTSSIEQHQSGQREQLRHSLRESTREPSMSIERISDTLKSFAKEPVDVNRNTGAIAKPKPMSSSRSFSLRHEVSVTQSHGSGEPNRSNCQDVSQGDADEYEGEDIPFVEATLLNQVRRVHRARDLLKSARPRSAIGTESIVNSNLESQVRRNSSASVNLVANYVGTVSGEAIEHQQEPTTQSSRHGQGIAPDTSHTPGSPDNVYIESNTLVPIDSEQKVRPEHNGEMAIAVSKKLRTVDSKASYGVHS